jgi:Tfp pilus assembly protein PilN
MAKDTITTIEIAESHVTLLQAKTARGNKVVTHCSSKRVFRPSDEDFAKIIAEFKTAKGLKMENLILILSRRQSIQKQLRLPSHNEDEIKKMINLRIVNEVPYQREDIIFEYSILDKEASGYTRVLVTIVHKDLVSRYLKIFNKLGLNPVRITLSSFGLLYWLNYQKSRIKTIGDSPYVVINIDDVGTEICFCYLDHLLYSRGINLGAKDLIDENLEHYAKQLLLTMKTYGKEEMGPEIRKAVIISSLPQIPDIQNALKQEFNITSEVMTPIDNLPCQKGLNISDLWGNSGISVAAGLGFLFFDLKKMIHLIPDDLKSTKISKLRKRKILKTAVLSVAAVGLVACAYGADLYQGAFYLRQLDDKLAILKPQLKHSEEQLKLARFVRGKIEGRVLITELFSELYDITPEKISFQSINLDAKGYLNLHGYSKDGASVNNLQSTLVNSKLFQDVNLQYATKLRIFNEELTDFKMNCRLQAGGVLSQ